ncbi:hypothetical protein J3454_15630 [Erythrobacter sp. NFXS35]|uniref:hypothetical protein n=1 Tax=Erythrobacter sp. NFXS35 TaxID=2818436 RepID=UPI0032DE3B50
MKAHAHNIQSKIIEPNRTGPAFMIWCRLCLFLVGMFIFVVANLAPGTVAIGLGHDKLNHALAFACLTPLAAFAFPQAGLISLLFALMLFNAGIELTQAALAFGREPDLVDWGVGVLATLPVLGAVAIYRFARTARAKE